MSGADRNGVGECVGVWLGGGNVKGDPREGREGTRVYGLEGRQLAAASGRVEAAGTAQPA